MFSHNRFICWSNDKKCSWSLKWISLSWNIVLVTKTLVYYVIRYNRCDKLCNLHKNRISYQKGLPPNIRNILRHTKQFCRLVNKMPNFTEEKNDSTSSSNLIFVSINAKPPKSYQSYNQLIIDKSFFNYK